MKSLIVSLLLILSAAFLFGQQAEGSSLIQIRGSLVENLQGSFSATFQASPLSDVFRIIGTETSLNIMVSPKINQTLTAKFKDVPIKDALLAVLSANDLFYLEQGSILKIVTMQEYKNELLRSYLQTKSYDASVIDIKNLATVLKPFLTPGVGTFSIDSQSSKILVTDIRDNFPRIDSVFKDVSTLPRMVEIETRILQIDLDKNNAYGINWSALDINKIANLTVALTSPSGVADNAINLTAHMIEPGSGATLDGLVSALSKDNKTRLVSQPRVLAMNREKASILIGSKVPYIKSITQNDVTARQTSQIDFIDTGVKLDVEPLITPENDMKLTIRAQLSSHKDKQITTSETAPEIITTEVSCNTVARDGQIIIIGGLIKDEKNTNTKKIPLLGDIPFLGYLFSSVIETDKKSELAIILIPRILKPGKSNVNFGSVSQEMLNEAGITNYTTNTTEKTSSTIIPNTKIPETLER